MNQSIIVAKRDRRESRGRVIALSRRVYRINNTDVFYVESESKDGLYYYVMFDTAKNFEWCSCPHFENRNQKCKHVFGVEYSIRLGTVKDTDKLPQDIKKDNSSKSTKSWKDDQYDF